MKSHPNNPFPLASAEGFAVKKRKPAPHEFVLDALASVSPWTRPMFGCLAVYVDEQIVLILRDKQDHAADNGVWLATTKEHHESLRREFPSMRSIRVLGSGLTSWQVISPDDGDFEAAALRACEMVIAGDSRIGKIPARKLRARPRSGKRKIAKVAKKTKKASGRRS